MKIAARVLMGIMALITLYMAFTFMFVPQGDLQQVRLGLTAADAVVGPTTIRAWIGGLWLGIALMSLAVAIRQLHEPFHFLLIFLGVMLLGRVVGLVMDGSSAGSMRAFIPEIVMLGIVLFARSQIGKD